MNHQGIGLFDSVLVSGAAGVGPGTAGGGVRAAADKAALSFS
jgi:hypothetical protein